MTLRSRKARLLRGCLRTLGCFFILATAPTAQAVTVDVNPGNVGSEAGSLEFILDSDALIVDLVFTDMKHLEFDAGILLFSIQANDVVPFDGFLSDELGDEIDGTSFSGATETGVIELTLQFDTIFHDMHFVADVLPFKLGGYVLVWPGTGPTVGGWSAPEPATSILLGLSLVGFAVNRRRLR